MKLSKPETERRHKAVFDYFTQNPSATGESLNRALTDGILTGAKEPALNIAKIYQIRREARAKLADAMRPPGMPQEQFMNAMRFDQSVPPAPIIPQSHSVAPPARSPQLTDQVRKGISEVVSGFPFCSPDITWVTIRRDGGVSLGRVIQQEEQVSLS
jgi:hypothetical protein